MVGLRNHGHSTYGSLVKGSTRRICICLNRHPLPLPLPLLPKASPRARQYTRDAGNRPSSYPNW